MKGLENPDYLLPYMISNVVALVILWAAILKPRFARWLFFSSFCLGLLDEYDIRAKYS